MTGGLRTSLAPTSNPEAPGYQDTQSQATLLFRDLDLSYDIEEWEILSITPDSARIRVVQVTRKIAGSQPFLDNRLEAIHRLRKNSAGEWKIYASEINQDNIEYLD